MMRFLPFWVFTGLILALTGCSGEGADRLAVRGTVNFEGKPLAKGNILFELENPIDPYASGAPIEDGKFAIAQPQGLKPGKYLVRISSADAIIKDVDQAPGDSTGVVAKERIPATWNSNSKQTIEVKAGATELTFDVK